jgi:hypothetical protein
MRNFPFAVFLLFLLSISAFAQNPNPTATPPADEENILKISTALIQVDVTVTDKKGNISKIRWRKKTPTRKMRYQFPPLN